jgi:hypothetical protein
MYFYAEEILPQLGFQDSELISALANIIFFFYIDVV